MKVNRIEKLRSDGCRNQHAMKPMIQQYLSRYFNGLRAFTLICIYIYMHTHI